MSKVTKPQQKCDTRHVCCRDCAHAILHRYGTNPLLAFCKLKPKDFGRLPFQVEVANAVWNCIDFVKRKEGEVEVMQLFQVRTYPKACYATSQTKSVV